MGNEAFMQLGLKLNGGQWGQWSPLYFHVRGWFVCPVLVYCWLDRLLTANLCLWFAQLSLNKDIFPANVEWQWLTTYDELCLQPPATVFRLQKRNQDKETEIEIIFIQINGNIMIPCNKGRQNIWLEVSSGHSKEKT